MKNKNTAVHGFAGDKEGNVTEYLGIKPHGYEHPIHIPVITKGSREGTGCWTWNGSIDSPTIKPSIKTTHSNGTISHLWLNEGQCQHLEDSTDGLAGQTLPLQEFEQDVYS